MSHPSPIDPDLWTFPYQVACRTMWAESRGEPEAGQQAVAHVLINRLSDGQWGKSLATVCLAKLQFSCWNASDEQRIRMVALADDDAALLGMFAILKNAERAAKDPTHGATHYYSDSMIVPPKWAIGMTFLVKIGHHGFYQEKK